MLYRLPRPSLQRVWVGSYSIDRSAKTGAIIIFLQMSISDLEKEIRVLSFCSAKEG